MSSLIKVCGDSVDNRVQFEQVNTNENEAMMELRGLLNSQWSEDDASSLEPARFTNAMFGFDKTEVMTYLKKLADFNEALYQQNEALKDYLRRHALSAATTAPVHNPEETMALKRQIAQLQQELAIQKEAYEEQQETFNQQIESFRNQYDQFQNQYGDYSHLEQDIKALEAQTEQLKTALKEAEDEKDSQQKTIDELMFLLEDNRAKLKEFESKETEVDSSIDYATEFSKQIVSSAYSYATKIKRDAEARMNLAIEKMDNLKETVEGISKDILTLTVAIEGDVEDTIKTINNTTGELESIKAEYINSMNQLNDEQR